MSQQLYGILIKNQLEFYNSIENFVFNENSVVWIVSPKPSIQEVIKILKNVWFPVNKNFIMLEVFDFRSDSVQFYKINKIIDYEKYLVLV